MQTSPFRFIDRDAIDPQLPGIVVAGGGGLLKNLDNRIREETGLPVCIADDPLCSVVLGTGKMLSDFKLLRRIPMDKLHLSFCSSRGLSLATC